MHDEVDADGDVMGFFGVVFVTIVIFESVFELVSDCCSDRLLIFKKGIGIS